MNRQLELPGFPRAQYAPLQQQQERQQRQPAPLRGSSGYDTARTLCYLGLGVTALALSIAVLSSVDAVHQDVALLLQQQGVVLAANPGNPANPANPVASAALLPTERFGAAAAPALAARGALEGALPPRFVSVASGPLPADLFEAAIAQTVRPALEAPNGLLGGCFARNSSHETCLLVALPAAANGSLVALLAAEREPHPLDALRVLTVPRDPVALEPRASPLREGALAAGCPAGLGASAHGPSRCWSCRAPPSCRCALPWHARDGCLLRWCATGCLDCHPTPNCGEPAGLAAGRAGASDSIYVIAETFRATGPGASGSSDWWTQLWGRLGGPRYAAGKAGR